MRAYAYRPIHQKTTLPNGVRVVTESHPFTRAVSVGMFIGTGTRHEKPRLAGITHFLEHMVFKGTRHRSALELARVLEAVGGDLNAYTTREYTCFHATSLGEHLPLCLDVLSDLVTAATLTRADFEKERGVIVEEIQMSKDNLEDYVFEAFLERAYRGTDLAIPILGTAETLETLTHRDLLRHRDEMFRGPNITVSVAGPVEHDEVVEALAKTVGRLNRKPKAHPKRRAPRPRKLTEFIHRPSEQVHLMVGLASGSYRSGHRFESFVVNDLLGGGVTSRLYQRVREDSGLVYTIYSFLQSFLDTGLFLTYAGTSPKKAARVLRIIRAEFERFASKRLREKDLATFKTQVKGQILLGAEDMENRMSSLGVNEMVFGEYRPVEDVIGDIDLITVDSVADYVAKYFDPSKLSLMVMGDLTPSEALRLLNTWE